MQRARFTVLTGHLSDYPLSELFGLLRLQRKTGRLLVEYPLSPGIFYFKDGDLVDARLNTLSGLQAVCVALAQPDSSFNFNPLIQTERRSIDSSLHNVVMELVGSWNDDALSNINVTTENRESLLEPMTATPVISQTVQESLPAPPRALALPPAAVKDRSTLRYRQRILFACILVTLMLSVPAGIALTNRFNKKAPAALTPATPVAAVNVASKSTVEEALNGPFNGIEDSTGNATGRESEALPGVGSRPGREKPKDEMNRARPAKQKDLLFRPAVAASHPSRVVERDETVNRRKGGDGSGTQAVKVIMQVENGRVLRASVAGSRPGMEAYEALALRIARGRRYPPNEMGQKTLLIKVNP